MFRAAIPLLAPVLLLLPPTSVPAQCVAGPGGALPMTFSGIEGAEIGTSVAVSGGTILVGAPSADVTGQQRGRVFHYEIQDGVWSPNGSFLLTTIPQFSRFGQSVAIQGDRAVVGAPDAMQGGPWPHGMAFVYDRVGGIWSTATSLVPPGGTVGDEFGAAVALDGDRVIIGNWGDDALCPGDSNCDSGEVRIYRKVGSVWQTEAALTASDPSPAKYFGYSVAIQGTTAVIGAPLDPTTGFQGGALYIYEFDGSTWNFAQKLLPVVFGRWLGASVSISGDTIAAGAPATVFPPSPFTEGAVLTFERIGEEWQYAETLRLAGVANNAWYGNSVSIEGSVIVAGAPNLSPDGVIGVHERIDGTWVESSLLPDPVVLSDDTFGYSVAFDGEHVVGGDRTDAELGIQTGAAAVYLLQCEDFRRGDCNRDGTIDVADPVRLLVQILGSPFPVECEDACDGNDDGALDIADAVALLDILFDSVTTAPPGFSSCAPDSPSWDPLDCSDYDSCP